MEKKEVETVEATVNDEQQKTVTDTEQKQDKLFTQDEVNELINKRFAREREKQEKTIEEQTAVLTQEKQTLQDEKAELEKVLSEKDKLLLGYQVGITPEKIDEALVVAELRASKLEIPLSEALEQVANDYQVVRAKKVGVEVVNQPKPSNPFITDALVRRHPHLAKVKKGE